MSLRRPVRWAAALLAVLIHLVAGIAGPGMQICVCTTGVTIAPSHTACCGNEAKQEALAGIPDGCTDCHIMPLPDDAAAPLPPALRLPPTAMLPAAAQIAVIIWPMRLEPSLGRPRGHPPDPVSRRVRTVILTC